MGYEAHTDLRRLLVFQLQTDVANGHFVFADFDRAKGTARLVSKMDGEDPLFQTSFDGAITVGGGRGTTNVAIKPANGCPVWSRCM